MASPCPRPLLDDYALTSEYESAERVRELESKLSRLPPAPAAGLLGTHRGAMAAALTELRHRFGAIDDYLVNAGGLTGAELRALRTRLTV